MSCLGSNTEEARNTITQTVTAIIESNGGSIADNGTITIDDKNLDGIKKQIRDFIKEQLGDKFNKSIFFIKKVKETNELKFSYPKTLDNILDQKFSMMEQEQKQKVQGAQEFADHEAMLQAMNDMAAQHSYKTVTNDPFLFDPANIPEDPQELQDYQHYPEAPFDMATNSMDVQNGNASYLQYLRFKKDLISEVRKSLSKFKITNRKGTKYYNEMVKKYNQTIEQLSLQITELDSNKDNIEVVYADVFKEIEYLDSVLDNISLDSLNVTELLSRLDSLSFMFLPSVEETKDSNIFAVNKHENYDVVNTAITNLNNKWRQKQGELIKDILESNSVVQQHIIEGKLEYTDEKGKEYTGEETLELIKDFIDNPTDNSWLMSRLYGAAKGGSVFGEILKLEMEVTKRNRQGKTGNIVKQIDIVFEKLAAKAEKGENIFEEFIQKDSLGVKSNMLVSKFSESWFKRSGEIKNFTRAFMRHSQDFKVKADNYKRMMVKMKANQDFLEIAKLKYFRDNEKFNVLYTDKYFKYSDEVMEEYEKDLIDRLGINFFNEMLKKQADLLEEWIETVAKDDMASANFKYESNPFEFTEHFYDNKKYKTPTDSGAFLYSQYSVYFPLSKSRNNKIDFDYFNKDFAEIEADPDKYEFWSLVNNLLTEYINPELQANGVRVKTYELPQISDLLSKEILKNAGAAEKGSLILKSLLDNYSKMFASPTYANLDKETDSNINTGYSNKVAKRIAEIRSILKTETLDGLVKLAAEEGIEYSMNDHYYSKLDAIDTNKKTTAAAKKNQKKFVEDKEKERLIKAIANKRVLSRTDDDFITILKTLASITDSLSARKTSLNIANILQDYVKSKSNKNESNKTTSLKNINTFFENFIKRNILQDTGHGDREKDEKGQLKTVGKILNKKVGNFNKFFNYFGIDIPALDWSKYMSEEDKKFRKFIEEEIDNIETISDFNFRMGQFKYTTSKGKFYIQKGKQEKKEVKREYMEDQYARYLGEKIENLGIDRTIGSLFNGFLGVLVQKSLWLNPKSGFRNLWEGGTKNMQVASSGRYGFGLEELQNAKTFLWGINTDRYLSTFEGQKALTINKSSKDHALNIKTYKDICYQFGLIQDKKNEVAKAEDYDTKKRTFKASLMDFAVENPEAHNQGELILSKLQTIYIDYIDENGETNSRPIFDGEKQDFIWIPGTMILKDEYRTEENVRMWENFLESKGENNQHLSSILEIQSIIESTQGNYNDNDIVGLQGYTLGRMFMMFKRFYPEHLWQNFGKQEYNLITGETNFKGRKRIMLEHAPVTAAYLTACGALSLTGGLGLFIGGGAIGMFVINFLVNRFVQKQKLKTRWDMGSLKLSLNFSLEILARSIHRPIEFMTRGKTPITKYFNHTVIGKIQEMSPPIMTSKDRAMLSENAQEIAQRVNLILGSMLIITALKALVMLVSGDDDEEYEENLKSVEGVMNLVLNTANTLNSQLDEMNNPKLLLENVGKIMMFQTLDNANRIFNELEKVMKEDADPSKLAYLVPKFLPILIPNSLVDQAFQDGSSFITDPRVYEEYYWNGFKDSAAKTEEKRVRNQRAKLKDEIQAYYFDIFTEQYPDESWGVRKARSKTAANKEVRKHYSKEAGESAGNILERLDFKAEEKAWRRGDVKPSFIWEDLIPKED